MLQQKPGDGADHESTFETVPTHLNTCPDCGGSVVDGQGLLRCGDCHWTALVA